MANLKASPATPILSKRLSKSPPLKTQINNAHNPWSESTEDGKLLGIGRWVQFDPNWREGRRRRRRALVCSSALVEEGEGGRCGVDHGQDGYLVREFGWGARRMAEVGDEMRSVAQVQAEAFHIPVALFNDLFFEFFKAEVLSALIYKIKNSPRDRYACLVAESINSPREMVQRLVGVVDVTVQRDEDVLRHLGGTEEYLYVSGIAVLTNFRRQKIATVLLKACDALSLLWGFSYLVLRAYEDDSAARKLYSNSGYKVVSVDPHWISWIGRKRRVVMIKSSVAPNIPYR